MLLTMFFEDPENDRSVNELEIYVDSVEGMCLIRWLH